MRAFIVLCFVAVVFADDSGYNYQQGIGLIGGGSISDLSLGSGSLGGGSLGGGSLGGGSLGGSSLGGGSFGVGGISGGSSYDVPSYSVPAAELDKEFYTFSAPENEFDDANAIQQATGSVKQGLRVIFIKSPENKGLEDAVLALAKQAAQQKTAIYVLNKQADIGDLANKINSINKGASSKPEVHFVKYRTSEDAANAQKAIQSQYESLGGNSQSVNGGVAPVLNFASASSFRGANPHIPQNAYLPTSVFRYRV